MIVTTTPHVEGRKIETYHGIVTGEAIIGANVFRDVFAGITDILGGRSRAYEAYAEPCQNADPAADTVPRSCRAFLDGNAKAAAEWRLERAFVQFESSYSE